MGIAAGAGGVSLSDLSGALREVHRVFTEGGWRVVDLAAEGDVVSLRIRFVGSGPGVATAGLCREGDYWSISWAGRVRRFRHAKGLSYLGALLARPGAELHALQLVAAAGGGVARADRVEGEMGVAAGAAGDCGPLVDEVAKSAYRLRLADLRDEMADAEACHDPERISRVRLEIDALTQQLAQAFGLGGRVRPAGSAAERARINVTRSLRAVIARVAEAFPDLGHHLDTTVQTGVFSAYRPGPSPALVWRLRTTEHRSRRPNAS
jgi:hypothetical protein